MPPGRYAPAYTPAPPPTQEELDALAASSAYAPVEPGMYTDPYVKPGQNAAPETLPDVAASNPNDERGLPVEPGMYTAPYTTPGHGNANLGRMISGHPVEPGMYEDTYVQPGQYATRDSASSYYGGAVWPPMWRGADHSVMTPRPNPSFVETSHPATGAPTEGRTIPDTGTAAVLQPGPAVYPARETPTGTQSIGGLLGELAGDGTAPPHPSITLAPSALEMGHHYQQGDPGVVGVPRLVGTQPHEVWRRDLSVPVADELKGLFGGGEQRSSQPMPLPPGSRRGRNTPPLKRGR